MCLVAMARLKITIKAMQEIQQLRGQISRIVEANFPGLNVGWNAKFPPPSSEQVSEDVMLRRVDFELKFVGLAQDSAPAIDFSIYRSCCNTL